MTPLASTADQAALVALTTAILSGRDLEAVLIAILAGEEEPPEVEQTDFAFRDRTRVKRAARLATSLLPPERPLLGRSGGPASLWVRRTGPARRAAYALAAARRLAVREPDVDAERRHAAAHLAAERGRREAAADADRLVAAHGPVLGWYAKRPKDEASSAGCWAAHGGNWHVGRPPIIEGKPSIPGTVHPSCRCRSGPPFPGGTLLA